MYNRLFKALKAAFTVILCTAFCLSLTACNSIIGGYDGELTLLDRACNSNSELKQFRKDFDKYFVGKSTDLFRAAFLGDHIPEKLERGFGPFNYHYMHFHARNCSLLVRYDPDTNIVLELRRAAGRLSKKAYSEYYNPDAKAWVNTPEIDICSKQILLMSVFKENGADTIPLEEIRANTRIYLPCSNIFYSATHSSCLAPLE